MASNSPYGKYAQYGILVRGLQQLALSAEEQLRVLPDFVDVPYECLDDFENGYLMVAQLVEGGLLSEAAVAAVQRLYAHVDAQLWRDPDYDEPTHFQSGEAWLVARRMAAEALVAMREPVRAAKPEGSGD
jgi:hypothetical protein